MGVKGIVLAGPGGRAAPDGVSALVHVANRPLLDHAVEAVRAAGAADVAVVTHPGARERVAGAVDADVELIEAAEAVGPAGALLAAEDFVRGEPVVLHAADGLLRDELAPLLAELVKAGADGLLLVYEDGVDATTRLDGHRVRRMLDWTPSHAGSLSLAGAHLFGAGVLARMRPVLAAAPGADVAAVVEGAGAVGVRMEARLVDGWRRYEGDGRTLLVLNRTALDELPASMPGERPGTVVEGRVSLHPSASVSGSVIRGPVVIGPGAHVEDAYVGPYTAIGADVLVRNCEVENSVLLAGAQLQHLGRLEGSVVGRGARVHRDFSLPRAVRLTIGDGADVTLP